MDRVVAPLDHRYAVPVDAVRFTLPPEQKDSGPDVVMVGPEPPDPGNGFGIKPQSNH